MTPSDRTDLWSAVQYLEDAGRWLKADASGTNDKAYEFAKQIERVVARAKAAFERIPKT